jgi:hypothetical protein
MLGNFLGHITPDEERQVDHCLAVSLGLKGIQASPAAGSAAPDISTAALSMELAEAKRQAAAYKNLYDMLVTQYVSGIRPGEYAPVETM